MNITVTCINCGQKLSAPANLAGRRVPCPKCKAPLDVPAAAPVGPPQPAAPVAAWKDPPPSAPSDAAQIDLGLGEPVLARRTARSRGNSNGILVPMIVVAALLFLAGGGIAAWMMLSKGGAGSDLRYVPDDSDFVFSADVNGILSSGAGQKIKDRAGDMLDRLNRGMPKDSKFKPEDVGRITMGGRIQPPQAAGVVHLNRAVSDQDFPDADKAVKKTVGQYQMSVNGKAAFCRIDERTVAIGEEDALRKILERNGPAKLSDELTLAMSEVDFSKSVAVAASLKNLAKAGGPGGMGPMAMMPGGPDALRGAALQADVGNDIRLKAIVLFKDATTADSMKKMADGTLAMAKMNAAQMPPEAAKVLDSLDISNSGATIRANLTIQVDTILSAMERFKTGMPAGPGAPGPSPMPPPANGPATQIPQSTFSNPPVPAFNAGQKTAGAASRLAATNNLKQIALALNIYLSANKQFPPPAIYDSQGQPLLSWRVAILPYLENPGTGNLYKQFHLDERWDSPNNKRLLVQMPLVYRSPRGKSIGLGGKTTMLAPVGEKYAFFGQQGRKLADFTDGISQTILVVEAAPERAVEWTRPDDLTIDENNPAAGLFGQRDGGFLAAFADGAVKFVPQSTRRDVLHALFTINGGETIPVDFGVLP